DLRLFLEEFSKPKGQDEINCKLLKTRVNKTLSKLHREFSGRTNIIKNRSLALSFYLYFEAYIEKKKEKELKNFSIFATQLVSKLKEESTKGFNRTNETLYRLSSYLSNAPGERYQIDNRHAMIEELYQYFQKHNKIKGY
ncbi:MAG: hypothetical protein ACXAC2_16310, partial [Candidatus Kariarchaeaceae archaeon]